MDAIPASPKTLLLIDELDDATKASGLTHSDAEALRKVAAWTRTFVAQPHRELGRPGPVCPFVPGAIERHTLWLAAERVGERSGHDIAELVAGYQKLFQDAAPREGDDTRYKSFVIVFPDLAEDRADAFFEDVLGRLAMPSYATDGFVMGGFHETSAGTAVYNSTFRPFTSPVPFLLMRQAVVSDWKFFLDDDGWLGLWADRYQAAGVVALGEELRRLPWRATPNEAT